MTAHTSGLAQALRHAQSRTPGLRLLHAVCITPSNTPSHSQQSLRGGQLLLTHCSGTLPAVLKEIGGLADEIVLDARCLPGSTGLNGLPSDPLRYTARALARCCRLGTRLQLTGLAGACAALEAALKPAGFATPANARPGHTWIYAPHWQQHAANAPAASMAAAAAAAPASPAPGQALVVGAGLAGAAVAASLARRGWQVCVLEAQTPASGASGVPVGLLAPHTSRDHSARSRISAAGLAATWAQVRRLLAQGPDWQQGGVLECAPAAAGRSQPASAAAQWHDNGGWVKPARLVHAWLAQPGIAVRAHCPVARLAPPDAAHAQWRALNAAGEELARASLVVLASGFASQALLGHLVPGSAVDSPDLPAHQAMQAIRGEITWGHYRAASVLTPLLPTTPRNGHGSLIAGVPADASGAAAANNTAASALRWFCGASYQRDAQNLAPRLADQEANLARLPVLLPTTGTALAAALAGTALHAWVGVRCASRDRLPLVGPVPGWSSAPLPGQASSATKRAANHAPNRRANQLPPAPGLWLCTALGSRGLSYAALCAELLATRLHREPLPLPASLARQLFAERR